MQTITNITEIEERNNSFISYYANELKTLEFYIRSEAKKRQNKLKIDVNLKNNNKSIYNNMPECFLYALYEQDEIDLLCNYLSKLGYGISIIKGCENLGKNVSDYIFTIHWEKLEQIHENIEE